MNSLYNISQSKEFQDKCVSFFLDRETADDLVTELYENDANIYEEYDDETLDILEKNEFIVVSKNYYKQDDTEEWFVEPLLHNGKQYESEADCHFLQDELLDVVDQNKLYGEIAVLNQEESEKEECVSEFIEELIEDTIEELKEKDSCIHCVLGNAFEEAYKCGYEAALKDIRDGINERICE